MRSRVVPQTIASETAQNTNWKNRSAPGLMSTAPRSGMSFAALAASWPTFRNQPCVPAMAPAPPKASANPTAQYASELIEKLSRIFATPAPAFFMREKPISSSANPACMNITRTPATITQVVLTLETVSDRVGPSTADAAAGRASAAVRAATAQARMARLRAGSGGAAPVARLDMDSSYWRSRRTSPWGGDLISATPPYGGVRGASLDGCRKSGRFGSPCGRGAAATLSSARPLVLVRTAPQVVRVRDREHPEHHEGDQEQHARDQRERLLERHEQAGARHERGDGQGN